MMFFKVLIYISQQIKLVIEIFMNFRKEIRMFFFMFRLVKPIGIIQFFKNDVKPLTITLPRKSQNFNFSAQEMAQFVTSFEMMFMTKTINVNRIKLSFNKKLSKTFNLLQIIFNMILLFFYDNCYLMKIMLAVLLVISANE